MYIMHTLTTKKWVSLYIKKMVLQKKVIVQTSINGLLLLFLLFGQSVFFSCQIYSINEISDWDLWKAFDFRIYQLNFIIVNSIFIKCWEIQGIWDIFFKLFSQKNRSTRRTNKRKTTFRLIQVLIVQRSHEHMKHCNLLYIFHFILNVDFKATG